MRTDVAGTFEELGQGKTPIWDNEVVLQKSEGKGGWTFAMLPVMPHLPRKRNSTVQVSGFIDDYRLEGVHIWAMKKGTFVPVRAEIRKVIKKESGDTIRLKLFLDEPASANQDDFLECLRDEPKLLAAFHKWSKSKQQQTTDFIFSAKTEDEKISRMAKAIEILEAAAAN